MPRALKSTARAWEQSKSPRTKYRDRKRVRLPDGTGKEVYGYGATKQAATEDLYRKVEALERHHPSAQTITVTALFAEFLQHKRSVKGNKAKTTFNDIKDFRLHIAPAIGELAVSAVTLHDLQSIQYSLTAQGKYRTAELVTISLKSFFNYAVRRYRDDIEAGRVYLRNVAADLDPIKRPPSTKPRPQLWTIAQLSAFLTAAKTRYDSSRRSLIYPLFYTALAAGLRRGELLGLKQTGLVTENEGGKTRYLLRITEQLVHYDKKHHPDTPKTQMGERDIPIDPALASALITHIEKLALVKEINPDWQEHGLMFPSYNGTPLEPSNIYRAKDELIKELELPKSTLHQLRKCYASYVTRNMIRAGTFSPKRLQALLGHSSPDTALKVYTLIVEQDVEGTTFDPLGSAGIKRVFGAQSENQDQEKDGD